MAEAILRHLSKNRVEVESAGNVPQSEIHPMAQERGSAFSQPRYGQASSRSRSIGFLGHTFDYVHHRLRSSRARVARCSPVAPNGFIGATEDPAAVAGTDADKQRAFDATRATARVTLPLVLCCRRSESTSKASGKVVSEVETSTSGSGDASRGMRALRLRVPVRART